MNIPKKLWHVWVGPKFPPTNWMDTWVEKHPTWEYTIIDNEFLKNNKFYNQHLIDEYFKRGLYNGVADLIRYEILYKHGGFMPPADAICLENTDELWSESADYCYTVYENEILRPGFVSPIYASNPNNDFLKKIIEDLHQLEPKQLKNKVYISTGNEYLGKMIEKIKPKIKIFPSHYFIPSHFTTPNNRYRGNDKIYAEQFWGSTLQSYPDENLKAFVICLSKIKSSYESALTVQKSLKKYGINSNLFEGTYGNDVEKIFEKENRSLFKLDNHSNSKSTSLGAKGCFHSHYRLWEKCVELNEPIIIFEDDVVIKRRYESIEFDDVLILSINYDWKITEPYRKYFEEDFSLDTKVDYKNYPIPGASGYIIKPHAAKRLVETYKNYYLAADWAINTEICKVTIHPRLIGKSKSHTEKPSMTQTKFWTKK